MTERPTYTLQLKPAEVQLLMEALRREAGGDCEDLADHILEQVLFDHRCGQPSEETPVELTTHLEELTEENERLEGLNAHQSRELLLLRRQTIALKTENAVLNEDNQRLADDLDRLKEAT